MSTIKDSDDPPLDPTAIVWIAEHENKTYVRCDGRVVEMTNDILADTPVLREGDEILIPTDDWAWRNICDKDWVQVGIAKIVLVKKVTYENLEAPVFGDPAPAASKGKKKGGKKAETPSSPKKKKKKVVVADDEEVEYDPSPNTPAEVVAVAAVEPMQCASSESSDPFVEELHSLLFQKGQPSDIEKVLALPCRDPGNTTPPPIPVPDSPVATTNDSC